MRLVVAIEDPDVAREILECLDLPARAPPLLPAPDESAWQESESTQPPRRAALLAGMREHGSP